MSERPLMAPQNKGCPRLFKTVRERRAFVLCWQYERVRGEGAAVAEQFEKADDLSRAPVGTHAVVELDAVRPYENANTRQRDTTYNNSPKEDVKRIRFSLCDQAGRIRDGIDWLRTPLDFTPELG